MPVDLFPGFRSEKIAGAGVDIHCRIGGDGPPLLLLHGYPQTGAMWHAVAGELAKAFTCVIADLRGYGESGIAADDPVHRAYSKRAMAADMVAVMRGLGHDRFAIAGHDRGARVAYRLALDTPEAVSRLAILDILPTYDYWAKFDRGFGLKIYHWTFLAQPAPLPEMLIGMAPIPYLEWTIASWTGSGNLGAFDGRALDHYRAFFTEPARLHATCEDYRAGATVDLDDDRRDVEAGNRIKAPLLALWGNAGISHGADSPLEVWKRWGEDVRGAGIDSGHFVAEENPGETLVELLPFLEG